jgi:O-antigen/teichoic acid export membrane protein
VTPYLTPEQTETFIALILGFALAGALASGYQYLMHRPASFRLLGNGPRPSVFAAIPFLAFAAPFIIMRNTLRGRRIEKRRFEFVMLATIISCFWSMMSGTVFVMALQAVGALHG